MAELPFSELQERLAAPGSDVWEVHDEAVQRLERGEDILLLSVGDPDFDTPLYISDYVIQRIREGRTHYSPAAGESDLRDAVAELEAAGTGLPIGAENIVVFPGATAALHATLATILNPGDGVITPEPMYIGYHGIFAAVAAEVQSVSLSPGDFSLDPEAVFAAVQPNTRAVLVNTPGNPCGNIIDPTVLTTLARGCAERNLWLICDEVYSLITFDADHTSLLKCTEDYSNVVVIDGLSKSHAMSGWRLGWVVAGERMTTALTELSGATTFGTCQFVQDGAAYALRNDAEDVEAMRAAYERRRDYVVQRLEKLPALGYFRPAAGMFVMMDVSRVASDGGEFSKRLLHEQGVSTIPGAGFGPSTEKFVRLSLTRKVDVLREAFDRIETMIAG